MPKIHPSAIVDGSALIHEGVDIGPFAIVGPHVELGEGCSVHAYAQILGHTQMGRDNVVHSHCVIGGAPQDKKYQGEPTRLVIGDRNTFRECCTVNLGTVQDSGVTEIGNDNWIMAYVHIAHDCRVGSHTIMANAVQLAGHVHVGDWAILGGITGVHQFVRVGAHAMTGAGTTLIQDLPPYVMATGNPASPHGINVEGLKRRGFSDEDIQALRRAYKQVYKSGSTLAEALSALAPEAQARPSVALLHQFLSQPGRGIIR
ncbi:MAG: acyl-[acyl-carrier-protein]-UDP-N-acetylglucosamine O-acyltransferase [Pseudomonadota bacterium]